MRKTKALIAACCVTALALAGLTVSGPAQAQTFGGNELMDWSIPGAPSSGVTSLTFPMTVGAGTSRRSGTYFAMQFAFARQKSVGYTGLQPRTDADGKQRLRGVFSSFIAGTTSSDPNCTDGADGGPGVSCAAVFETTYGHGYEITVQQVGADTWAGSAIDTTTGASVHLGSYTLPAGSGLLKPSQVGFVEYYSVRDCGAQPYYDVSFGRPRSGSLTGTVTWDKEYGECVGVGDTMVSDTADGGVRVIRGTVDRPAIGLGSASWLRGGKVTIRGWAQPGSRLKTTNDPDAGWYDPEDGPVYAAADGSFTLTTRRLIDKKAAVKSFDPVTNQGLTESDHVALPQPRLDSARNYLAWLFGGKITIRGWAQPGSRLKTTNDPGVGWYDPEDGPVYAAADGSFTLTTRRLIDKKAAVKTFDPVTDQGLSETEHIRVDF